MSGGDQTWRSNTQNIIISIIIIRFTLYAWHIMFQPLILVSVWPSGYLFICLSRVAFFLLLVLCRSLINYHQRLMEGVGCVKMCEQNWFNIKLVRNLLEPSSTYPFKTPPPGHQYLQLSILRHQTELPVNADGKTPKTFILWNSEIFQFSWL